MRSEKRKFLRLPVHGFMKCFADLSLNQQSIGSIPVLSLSAGGMFIAVARDTGMINHGDLLREIRFDLSALQGITVDGKVVHRMSLGEIGGCGVEFENVSQQSQHLLDQFVQGKLKELGLSMS